MPGDLNLKKSWNPALMKNQKKIWEREQDALKEHQAIKQRTKEIAAEREKEEMIKLQYGADLSKLPQKQKLELSKLGWMYTDAPKDSNDDDGNGFQEVEEDFLQNTAQVEQLLQGNTPALQSLASRFDKVASVGLGRVGSSLNDDPLLLIKRQQRQKSLSRDKSPNRISKESERDRGTYSRSERSDRSGRSKSSKDSSEREGKGDHEKDRSGKHRSDRPKSSSHHRSSHGSSSHGSSNHRSSDRRPSNHRSATHKTDGHRTKE